MWAGSSRMSYQSRALERGGRPRGLMPNTHRATTTDCSCRCSMPTEPLMCWRARHPHQCDHRCSEWEPVERRFGAAAEARRPRRRNAD
jgi:hypothetical protein